MTTARKLMTADQLLRMPDDGFEYELVRGELTEKMPPPGDAHGDVTGRFSFELRTYTRATGHGVVRDNAGFILESNPDTVRAPDIAWIAPGRISGPIGGYQSLTPDLVVEIKSPSDSPTLVTERARTWLDFGAREVWYGDPETITVTRYRSDQEPEIFSEHDTLDGGDILPGFGITIWRLFRDEP